MVVMAMVTINGIGVMMVMPGLVIGEDAGNGDDWGHGGTERCASFWDEGERLTPPGVAEVAVVAVMT